MINLQYMTGDGVPRYSIAGEPGDIEDFLGDDAHKWVSTEDGTAKIHLEPNDLPNASALARDVITKLMAFKLQPHTTVVARYSELRSREGIDMYNRPALRKDFAAWLESGEIGMMPASVADGLQRMNVTLHPEQMEGLTYWYRHRGRAILAWVMGAGKTLGGSIIAHAFNETFKHTRLDGVITRIVILCPANMTEHWERSLQFWGMTTLINPRGDTIQPTDAVIISYSQLTNMKFHLPAMTPGNPLKLARLIIVDECQRLKNHESETYVSAKKLIDACANRILGSGTPALNRPIEWFPQLALVRPDLYADRHKFALRYCNAKKTAFGWDYKGNSRLDELHQTLASTCVHFISKVPGMPAMHRYPLMLADMEDLRIPKNVANICEGWIDHDDIVPLETQRMTAGRMAQEIHSAVSQYIDVVNDNLQTFVALNSVERIAMTDGLQKVETLFQLLARIKLPFALNHLRQRLKDGARFIVASHYETTAKQLHTMLGMQCSAELITGATSMPRRQEIIQAAQDGDVDALIVTTASVGVGVDGLQKAFNEGYVIDAEVVPGLMQQLEARLWRQGQPDAVQWFYMVVKNSIDEQRARMLFQKLAILSSVNGGAIDAATADTNTSIMGDLLALFVGSKEVRGAAEAKQLQQISTLNPRTNKRPGNRGSSKQDIMGDLNSMHSELQKIMELEQAAQMDAGATASKPVTASQPLRYATVRQLGVSGAGPEHRMLLSSASGRTLTDPYDKVRGVNYEITKLPPFTDDDLRAMMQQFQVGTSRDMHIIQKRLVADAFSNNATPAVIKQLEERLDNV